MADRIRSALGTELDAEQRALRARILESRSSDSLVAAVDGDALPGGPFAPMLLAPHIGDALQEVGGRLRFAGALPDDMRESVTLCVAGHRGSGFELGVHRGLALDAGVRAEVVEALSAGDRPPGLPAETGCAIDLARTVLARERVDDTLFDEALSTLGPVGLFEVVVLCGYYNLLADILEVFDVDTPPAPGSA